MLAGLVLVLAIMSIAISSFVPKIFFELHEYLKNDNLLIKTKSKFNDKEILVEKTFSVITKTI